MNKVKGESVKTMNHLKIFNTKLINFEHLTRNIRLPPNNKFYFKLIDKYEK